MSSALGLSQAFSTAHPEEATRLLERLDPDQAAAYLDGLPGDAAVVLLRSMMPVQAVDCLDRCDEARAAELVGALAPLDARSILMRLSSDRRSAVLERLPREPAAALARLLRYPDDSVGAWVDSQVPSVVEAAAVGDALDIVTRRPGHEGGGIWLLSAGQRLRGYLLVSRLLAEEPTTALTKLDILTAPTLSTRASLGSVSTHRGWKDHEYLPVVDREERFVGVLRHGVLATLLTGVGEDLGHLGSGAAVAGLLDAYWTGLSTLLEAVVPVGGAPDKRIAGGQAHGR